MAFPRRWTFECVPWLFSESFGTWHRDKTGGPNFADITARKSWTFAGTWEMMLDEFAAVYRSGGSWTWNTTRSLARTHIWKYEQWRLNTGNGLLHRNVTSICPQEGLIINLMPIPKSALLRNDMILALLGPELLPPYFNAGVSPMTVGRSCHLATNDYFLLLTESLSSCVRIVSSSIHLTPTSVAPGPTNATATKTFNAKIIAFSLLPALDTELWYLAAAGISRVKNPMNRSHCKNCKAPDPIE